MKEKGGKFKQESSTTTLSRSYIVFALVRVSMLLKVTLSLVLFNSTRKCWLASTEDLAIISYFQSYS